MIFSSLARINFNKFRLKPVFALVVVCPGVSQPACRMYFMHNHNIMVTVHGSVNQDDVDSDYHVGNDSLLCHLRTL